MSDKVSLGRSETDDHGDNLPNNFKVIHLHVLVLKGFNLIMHAHTFWHMYFSICHQKLQLPHYLLIIISSSDLTWFDVNVSPNLMVLSDSCSVRVVIESRGSQVTLDSNLYFSFSSFLWLRLISRSYCDL